MKQILKTRLHNIKYDFYKIIYLELYLFVLPCCTSILSIHAYMDMHTKCMLKNKQTIFLLAKIKNKNFLWKDSLKSFNITRFTWFTQTCTFINFIIYSPPCHFKQIFFFICEKKQDIFLKYCNLNQLIQAFMIIIQSYIGFRRHGTEYKSCMIPQSVLGLLFLKNNWITLLW